MLETRIRKTVVLLGSLKQAIPKLRIRAYETEAYQFHWIKYFNYTEILYSQYFLPRFLLEGQSKVILLKITKTIRKPWKSLEKFLGTRS